jgi:hypothetical protein
VLFLNKDRASLLLGTIWRVSSFGAGVKAKTESLNLVSKSLSERLRLGISFLVRLMSSINFCFFCMFLNKYEDSGSET